MHKSLYVCIWGTFASPYAYRDGSYLGTNHKYETKKCISRKAKFIHHTKVLCKMSTTQTHMSVQTFSSTRNSTVTNSSKDSKCYACSMADDSQSKIGNKNPITLVKKAREIWLEKSDVRTAKKLYLRALQCSKENALAYNVSSESSLNYKGGESKKRKLGSNALVTLSSNQTREVIEKIALLLIQSG